MKAKNKQANVQLRPAAVKEEPRKAPQASIQDDRPEAALQRKLQTQAAAPVQRQENKTGLPDTLKSGIENLSGLSMDDVRVHRNSAKPAQLNAHAYAQGTDIHLAAGQEKHLAHEAWHVVQQKQGRVKPTRQMKGKVAINDDAGLEKEADVMGAKALRGGAAKQTLQRVSLAGGPAQCYRDEGVREQTDRRMDVLRQRTGEVIGELQKRGESWASSYGGQGKEMASSKMKSLLEGGELIDKEEIKRQALKKLWSEVPTEDKIAMVEAAAKIIGSGARDLLTSLTGGSTSERSGSSSRSGQETERSGLLGSLFGSGGQRRERKPRSESSPGSSWISSLSREQVRAIYEVYQQQRKLRNKLEEAKQRVIKTAGDVGERVGSGVGETREEIDFSRQVGGQREHFIALREAYLELELMIDQNDDTDRYRSELDALHDALFNINGPFMAYRGELSTEARKNFPEVCRLVLSNLESSGSFWRKAVRLKAKATKTITAVKEGVGVADEELPILQSQLSTKVISLLDADWNAVTKYGATPKGVKRVKKAVDRSLPAVSVLESAVAAARPEAARDSPRRSEVTRKFYQTLRNLNVGDKASLREALDRLNEVGESL